MNGRCVCLIFCSFPIFFYRLYNCSIWYDQFLRWINITRYDVRAELSDVSQFEAPPGGYDNRMDYLSPAEQRAEQLCEEERYFSLYNNDFEEELYKGINIKETIYVQFFSQQQNSILFHIEHFRRKPEKTECGIWTNWIQLRSIIRITK